MADNYNTDVAGILIGNDDCDVATALAASYRPQPASIEDSEPMASGRYSFNVGLLAGIVV